MSARRRSVRRAAGPVRSGSTVRPAPQRDPAGSPIVPAMTVTETTEAAPVHLRVEHPSDGVVLLVLDNPAQRNAMSAPMTETWAATIRELHDDRSVRVVVVTGSGSAFCSGGDPRWIAGEPDAPVHRLRDRMLGFYRSWLSIRDLEVPTIAAINGPAIGAGLDLACMCDVRVASDKAVFAESFVKLGIVPGDGGAWLLPRVIGFSKAVELTLTGETIDAARALEIGLVSRVVPGDQLLDTARAIADKIAANPPHAVRMTRRLLREAQTATLAATLELSAAMQSLAHATRDNDEAIDAFIERRAPDFRGE